MLLKTWVRFVLAGTAAASLSAGQAVISARSGVIHFSEGSVFIDGQPIEHHAGLFETLKNGSELRTKDGKAEVLLASGVFLRLNEKTAIRMVSNSLGDGRVEMLEGSALLESSNLPAGAHLTIAFKECDIRVPDSGSFRLDSDPARITVEKGATEISLHGSKSVVKQDEAMDLTSGSAVARSEKPKQGALEDWAQKRDTAISADDKSADKVTDDLSVAEDWEEQNGITGLGAAGAGAYSGLSPYASVPYVPTPRSRSYSSIVPSPLPIVPLSPLNSYAYTTPGYPYLYPYSVLSYSPLLVQRGLVPIFVGAGVGTSLYSPLRIWRTRVPGSLGIVAPAGVPRVPIGAGPHSVIGVHPGIGGAHLGGRR